MSQLRVVSWNILAPELFMYFWRSSYGLEAPADNSYYSMVHLKRINLIIEYLKGYNPDIICLQETTNSKYYYLDKLTVQNYIAQKAGYTVVANSYKKSPFRYNFPPQEQLQTHTVDSGVSTLVKTDSSVRSISHIASAEDFGPSEIFRSGIGSPFSIDQFKQDQHTFYVINVHIRMQYPHIHHSINEVYSRVSSKLNDDQLKNSITIGDFNAHSLIAGRELFTSDYYLTMFDKAGHELIDDHVFVGHTLRQYDITVGYGSDVPLLEMNANIPSVNPKYRIENISYNKSTHNQHLVDSGTVTTDHYPIIVDIVWKKSTKLWKTI